MNIVDGAVTKVAVNGVLISVIVVVLLSLLGGAVLAAAWLIQHVTWPTVEEVMARFLSR